MRRLIGTIKAVIASVCCLGLVVGVVFALNDTPEDDLLVIVVGTVLIILVASLPLYYLVRTAIWDFYDRLYSKNILVLIGIGIYLLWCVYFIYAPIQMDAMGFLPTSALFGVAAIALGIRDLRKILKDSATNEKANQNHS